MKKVYIKSYNVYIPNSRITSKEISYISNIPEEVIINKFGIMSKPIEMKKKVSEMCIETLKNISASENIKESVSTLIYAGSDFKDNYIWTIAPFLSNSIGLKDVLAFDISSQCVGSLVAVDSAKLITSHTDDRMALVSVGTKQSYIINYKDPESSFMYDFSDGAVSILIGTGGGKYEILESSFITDGSFSEVVYSPFGDNFKENKNEWSYKLRTSKNAKWREKMGKNSKNNFLKVINSALEKSGLTKNNIDYLAFLHTKPSFFNAMMDELELAKDKSIYLENYGHMQGVDPFLSLKLAEESGKIHKNAIIVLVSAGTGWTWGATVIKAT